MKCIDLGCSLLPLGSAQSHCVSCHDTFSNPTTFDSHRSGGRCTAVPGLVQCQGVWGTEEYVAQVERMRVARSAR